MYLSSKFSATILRLGINSCSKCWPFWPLLENCQVRFMFYPSLFTKNFTINLAKISILGFSIFVIFHFCDFPFLGFSIFGIFHFWDFPFSSAKLKAKGLGIIPSYMAILAHKISQMEYYVYFA